MRKLITTGLIAVLAIVMGAATVQAQNPTSGTTGPLTWKYDTGTKTLTISGKGDMPNYTWKHRPPWREHSWDMQTIAVDEGVTGIGDYAFEYASKLTSVTLPKTLTRIGDDAFSNSEQLSLITLPAGLQEIGHSAFAGCLRLSAVTIPVGVKSLGAGAFASCWSLPVIAVVKENAYYESVDGVLFDKAKTTLVQYPAGRAGTSYTIPAGVTSIGVKAFDNASRLIEVTLPAGLVSIGKDAFANCFALNTMAIPASVKTIEVNVFNRCRGLMDIKVDVANTAYTSVDGVLFDKVKKTLITYPGGRKTTTYVIPSGVTNIEEAAFLNCSKLTTVTIPVGVKKIGSHAFARSGLSSVAIPAGIDTISDGAFGDCWNLASITLPSSVKAIGEIAFFACRNLRDLTVGMKNPPDIDKKNVFEGVPVANVTLTVPKGSKAAYAAAPVWKEFKQISESTVGNVTLPEARIYAAGGRLYLTLQTAAPVGIYTLNGVLVRTFSAPAGETTVALPQGVYIVRVGDTAEKVMVD